MSVSKIAVVALCCLLAVSLTAAAQTTGNIDGTVADDTGAVLPGATVILTSEAILGSRTAVTNNLGSFRFRSLPVGDYSVEASLTGFQILRLDDIEVSLGKTTTVRLPLSLATVAESVTVVGESPIVDVRNAASGTNFKNEILEEVPTQRNFYDLMQVSGGMTADVGDSQSDRVVAFGSNRQSNSWNIDGINVSAPETGSSWWTVNVDNIEEIQVHGVGAPAEFGSHLGAVLNVVTKKGGNDFHGGANFFLQTDGLTGSNVVADPITGERCPEGTEGCLGFTRDQYRNLTGQIGGPIVEDRAWFYGSYSYFRDLMISPGNPPAVPGTLPYSSDMFDIKVTTKLSERHEVSGLFHTEAWDSGVSPAPTITPSANSGENGSNPAWGASLTSILSDTTLLELKYAGWWSDDIYQSATGSFDTPFIDYTPVEGGPTTYSGGLWYPWDYVTWMQQFNAKVSSYAEDFLSAQHDFRFGVQFSKGSAKTNVGIGPTGVYEYHYYGYLYRVTQEPYQYGGETRDLGLFLDDTVTVNDRVTLNLGVRADFQKGWVPDYERLTVGEPSISPSGLFATTGETVPGVDVVDWKNVSPRIGVTFQPTEDGRSVIRGSFGVYYDQNVIGNWDVPAPGNPTLRYTYFDPDLQEFVVFDEISAADTSFSDNLKAPRSLQYSAGFEQQFGTDIAVGVQYVYKDTSDLVGWEILDGVWAPVPFTDPFTGNTYTLLNQVERGIIQKGNDPGNFPGAENLDYEQKYHGVVLSFNKRFSDRWGLMASYTWSKSEGLLPRMLTQTQFNPFYGDKNGSDPNNFLNAYGRLQGDRPHMFRTQAVFRLPGDIQIGAALNLETGKAHTRQIRTSADGQLEQGSKTVIMAPGGSFDEGVGRTLRFPNVNILDLSVGWHKPVGAVILKFDGTIYNVFNSDTGRRYASLRLQEPGEDFIADRWWQPQRLMIRVGFDF
jgi:hypothetical protein